MQITHESLLNSDLEPTEQQAQRLRQLGGCDLLCLENGLAETKRILDAGETAFAFELNRMSPVGRNPKWQTFWPRHIPTTSSRAKDLSAMARGCAALIRNSPPRHPYSSQKVRQPRRYPVRQLRQVLPPVAGRAGRRLQGWREGFQSSPSQLMVSKNCAKRRHWSAGYWYMVFQVEQETLEPIHPGSPAFNGRECRWGSPVVNPVRFTNACLSPFNMF